MRLVAAGLESGGLMHRALERLEQICDERIALRLKEGLPLEPTRRVPKEREHHTQKDYVLPEGVVFDDEHGLVRIPGSTGRGLWTVDVQAWTCNCPAYRKWPPCKHVRVLKEMTGVA